MDDLLGDALGNLNGPALGSTGFGSAATLASRVASDESATELSGWLSLEPSR